MVEHSAQLALSLGDGMKPIKAHSVTIAFPIVHVNCFLIKAKTSPVLSPIPTYSICAMRRLRRALRSKELPF